MAPPYVDENPNLDLVEAGLDEADSEIREAVADAYEASARLSSNPEDDLDDVDYTMGEGDPVSPEVAAIHEEFIPLLDEEDPVE